LRSLKICTSAPRVPTPWSSAPTGTSSRVRTCAAWQRCLRPSSSSTAGTCTAVSRWPRRGTRITLWAGRRSGRVRGVRSRMDDPTVIQCDWFQGAKSLTRGSIDLVYADPPFNTGVDQTDRAGRFADSWPTTEAYTAWLRDRLIATLPALKPSASILLHL